MVLRMMLALAVLVVLGPAAQANNYGMMAFWTDSAINTWAFWNGDQNNNQSGVYNSTSGSFAASNRPGSRRWATTWVDSSNNLWMFGGRGYDNGGNFGYLNDLWKYDTTVKQWAWFKGSKTVAGATATFGTKGTGASGNVPNGLGQAAAWTAADGTLWMFGGYREDNSDFYANMWQYNTSTNYWTYQQGLGSTNQATTVFSTSGTFSSSNTPGNIGGSMPWVDPSTGYLFMFGGYYASSNLLGEGDDIWAFSTSTKQWAWYTGSKAANNTGTYGTAGSFNASYMPPGRDSGCLWRDPATGYIWQFGGEGTDNSGNSGPMNDLWKYNPTSLQWAWVAGSKTNSQVGTYGAQGVASTSYIPGARQYTSCFTSSSGNFYFFGGSGMDINGAQNNYVINDLWVFKPGAGTWTWLKGSLAYNATATVGTQYVGASVSTLGARYGAAFWTTNTGSVAGPGPGGSKFWVFGGDYNSYPTLWWDLWMYRPR